MMEPQAAKWTRDYITKITFLSYRITAYNKREPVDTVYRGIVLNCSGRLTTFYNLDLVLPGHRLAIHRLAGLWWHSAGYPECCDHRHLPISLFYDDMSRFDYALTTFHNSAIIDVAGPAYCLFDHFSTGMKRRKIRSDGSMSPGLTYKPKSRTERSHKKSRSSLSLPPLSSPTQIEPFPGIRCPTCRHQLRLSGECEPCLSLTPLLSPSLS
jgi:hypothetical protein